MPTRSLMAALIVLATLYAHPAAAARDTTQAEEAMLALAAVGTNLVYVPAKTVVAIGGGVVGAAVGLLTGGDARSAYAIWVPTASGTFILRADNMDGTEPIQFFGSDYADEPSPLAKSESGDGGTLYESLYR